MAPINKHHSTKSTKVLLIGDSGAGKTGALASLAAAGFKLRIIDLDNGLDILRDYLTNPASPYLKSNPDLAENVSFVTCTDTMQNLAGTLVPKKVEAWQKAMSLLVQWKDGEENLGQILEWDSDVVLVIDSLTFLSRAAHNFHLQMNGLIGKTRTQNEHRRDIGATQNLLRTFLNMIFDKSIKCNVILTSHITFVSESGESPGSMDANAKNTITINGYPSAIGRALSPQIPTYFNSVLVARTIGYGNAAQHKIFTTTQTVGGQLVNAKSAAPLRVKESYPLATGLADYFKDVRGG